MRQKDRTAVPRDHLPSHNIIISVGVGRSRGWIAIFRLDKVVEHLSGVVQPAFRWPQIIRLLRSDAYHFPKFVGLGLRRFAVVEARHVFDLGCRDIQIAIWPPA